MTATYFRYFKHVLLKFDSRTKEHAIDLDKLLLDLQVALGMCFNSKSISDKIDEISNFIAPLRSICNAAAKNS